MTWAPEHARRERPQLTDGAKGAPVPLSSCQVPALLTIAVADVRSANTVLTTTMAACGPTWTPASGPWVNYLIIWATTDTAGSAQPPEKRKVGSSILPLTTILLLPLSWANTYDRLSWSVPMSDRQAPLLAPVSRT